MENFHLPIQEARQIDMVEYLEKLGCQARKIRKHDYLYLSPLREEKEVSFQVNRKINAWYDHGLGQGGNIIDFGILYHNCSVKEVLEKLQPGFSFRPQTTPPIADEKGKITIVNPRPISSLSLQKYLKKRAIPIDLANQYCRKIIFELYGKKHIAIGFQNNAGGYELRNEYFKGSSSPKDVTLINHNSKNISVFEGFFSFLSYAVLQQNKHPSLTNQRDQQTGFIVLNSLFF